MAHARRHPVMPAVASRIRSFDRHPFIPSLPGEGTFSLRFCHTFVFWRHPQYKTPYKISLAGLPACCGSHRRTLHNTSTPAPARTNTVTMAALKILAVATMAVLAQGMELTQSNFQAEVKDSGKNAFVSFLRRLFSPRVDPSSPLLRVR